MWGDSRSANRTGPFRGSQEERFAPGWNRDYPPPPLKSHVQERHSGNFPGRDSLPFDFQGHSGPPFANVEEHSFSYGARDGLHGDYRGGEGPGHDFRGGDFSSSDFQSRDSTQLDFRGRDIHSGDFRDREGPPMDYRGEDGTSVDYRGRETSHMNYRDRDAHTVDFRGRHRSRTDQDFRGREMGPCLEFKDREMPSVDPNILDYIQPSTQDREHSGMSVNKREESTHDHTTERPAFGIQKGEFEHSETREGETQGVAFEHESPADFQNSQSSLQDQDKSQLSGGEQQSSDASLFKEEGGLDFLGRQDTDYRSMEYRDVDHRLPGSQIFGYGQSKSFPEGKTSQDAQRDLQDQDYRTGQSEEKPSKLIRLSGVPENATKEEILNAFRTPDGMPVKDLQLKEFNTGYDYGYVCVEFSLLEDAIGCMEANQGTLMIHDKEVTLEYVPSLDFWYCKRCKASTGGHRSCSFCKCPREVTEAKQELITYPQPQKTSIPAPSEKQPSQPPRSADKEPEPRKREEGQEPRLGHQKREAERYLPSRREGINFRRDREKEPWSGETRQDGESKTIMLKRIYRSTPPEVIVEVLEPYVRLTTANVRIIKNRTGPMGHTYGFIDLDSHAEALRVVKILQNLDPPFSIDGKMVAVNLATGKRRNDSGDHSDHMHYYQGKKYFRDRRGGGRNSDWSSDTNRQGQQSSSDCYIYDSATGYYYDPLAGTYYDPNTQQEVYVPQDPESPEEEEIKEKKPTSQGKSSSKKETFKRDGKEKKDRGVTRFQENSSEGTAPPEDVFKKPLPPTVKKEESPPPPKVVNPLIGLLGEYGGDSDYEEEEEEEQTPPPQPRTAQPQREEVIKKENEEEKLTDWNKLACLLCRRQFPNKEVLIKHQQLSDLHKQNLEIHRKIKQSEQELAYLERREREGRFKERGNDRREKLQSFDSPERKRIKYSRETDSDRKPVGKEGIDNSSKGGCVQQATGWRKGTGLGYGHLGLASAEETEGRIRGPSVGAPGRTSKRQSNETYRDAVRRVMFARYKELD
uniref:RNA binding motif protein 6 n=1 Tax=Sus scrofa TaxID=9823 RepID=A0A4X1SN89_PIG